MWTQQRNDLKKVFFNTRFHFEINKLLKLKKTQITIKKPPKKSAKSSELNEAKKESE